MSESIISTGVDEVHAHPHKTGHHWLDLAVAFSAIAISIISLFVAIGHGRTEEKLVAASSWPFLTIGVSKNGLESDGWTINLRLRNSGVGPARVQWFRLVLDGQPIRNRAELMRRCCGIADGPIDSLIRLGLVSQAAPAGVLMARDRVDLLTWRQRPGNEPMLAKLDNALNRVTTQACYCSVLDECWISDLTATAEPRRVDRCLPAPDNYQG